jgi:hypothetical protein
MGVSGQRHASTALYPQGKGPPVPIGWEAGWASEPVWTQGLEEKSSAPCRGSNFDHPIVQLVVRHHTAWATAALLPEGTDRIASEERIEHETYRYPDISTFFTSCVQGMVLLNRNTHQTNNACRYLNTSLISIRHLRPTQHSQTNEFCRYFNGNSHLKALTACQTLAVCKPVCQHWISALASLSCGEVLR